MFAEETTVSPTAMACARCGTVMDADALFCASCGAVGSRSPEAVVAPGDELLERLRAATRGELEIIRQIGSGGMARVYLARQLRLQREIAVKVISPELLSQPEMIQRFHREANTIAGLRHPHIVTVYDAHQAMGLHWFTMEFVRGRSLTELLEAASAQTLSLPIALVRALLYDIASALAYAHRRGVVHRDVKPQNVLLNEQGESFVTDFGLAKIASAPSLTQPNMIMGTPYYMSPEQWCGLEVGAATDQYALGVIAYEMLTGVRPFSGSTESIMLAHVTAPPPAMQRPGIPGELGAGVMRMLEKKPEDRWADLDAAIRSMHLAPLPPGDDLQGAVVLAIRDGRWPPATAAERAPAAIATSERSRWRLDFARWPRPSATILVATLLIIAIGTIYALVSHRGSPKLSDSASEHATLSTRSPAVTPQVTLPAAPLTRHASTGEAWLRLTDAEQLSERADYDSASVMLHQVSSVIDSLQADSAPVAELDRLVDRLRSISQRNHLACVAERAILMRRSAAAAPVCR
jgi:serine/threonine protein kinase